VDLRVFTEPQQGSTHAELLRVAQATEQLGFDAFFRSDHYHAIGGGDGRPGSSDAWLTLAALAGATTRIRLGTLVSPTTFRLPGPLAIQVAQVDQISGGRVELGLGAGWFEREHQAYGIPYPDTRERFDRFAEQVEIIDGLLRTPDGSSYSHAGRHYTLVESPALPKPTQRPRPPIILGGSAKRRSAELAAQYADEYNVAFARAEVADRFARIRAAAAGTGRELVYSVALTVCVGRDDAEVARRAEATGRDPGQLRAAELAGTPAEVVDVLGGLAELGATRIYLQLLDLRDLDHLELIAAEVAPQL
jgi:F420-dependent oxidoreductase-like protein